MKTTVFAVVTLLLAVIEVSAQPAGGGAKRCPNGGYKGNVTCCDVNSAQCQARASSSNTTQGQSQGAKQGR